MHTASAQRSTSLQWHLPIDPEARAVADACDSAGILVPSIQPMTGWNRPHNFNLLKRPFLDFKSWARPNKWPANSARNPPPSA